MSDKQIAKPIALAVGTALAGSFAIAGAANADTGASPFATTTLRFATILFTSWLKIPSAESTNKIFVYSMISQ